MPCGVYILPQPLLDSSIILSRVRQVLDVRQGLGDLGAGGLGALGELGVSCGQLAAVEARAPQDLALHLVGPELLLHVDVVGVVEVAHVEVEGVFDR